MTVEDLKEVMNGIIALLQKNKETMTPHALALMERTLNAIEGTPAYMRIMAAALDISNTETTKLLDAGRGILDLEQRLVMTGLSEKIITVLTNIQGHPLVMRLIAGFL